MKLAFIFDTVMLKDESNNYYSINLNYNLWKNRYLKVFDEVIVSTRYKECSIDEIKEKKGYTLSNGENVEIIPISEYNVLTDVFFKRKKIEKQIKSIIDKVDAVIIRLPSPLGNIACDVCRKYNKKYAIEMVACAWDGYRNHGHWAGKIVAPYMFFSTKKQCRKAKNVLYVTEKFLQKRYPTYGKTTNASNVIMNETTEDVLNKRLEKIDNMNPNSFVLGLVGPLELKSKGQEIALKALKILKDNGLDVKIEFLGAGNKEKLENISKRLGISESVSFLGTLPSGNAVYEWMDKIDILVIPSFQEGLPRVLIEAMSRGCPAVGARTGGIPELIEEKYIHKAGDYKKLANDIMYIANNKIDAKNTSIINFKESKKYCKENLDIRRNNFWKEFRDQ